MSQNQTSQQSDCDHITKVLEWEYVLDEGQMYQQVISYGCTRCNAVSESPFPTEEMFVDHSNCKIEPCFGCKAKTLQLNAGDATRDIPDKKWNAELKEYKKARDEGLRPAGTTYAHIEEARTASETLGTAYNAETMPKAKDITKNTAEVMKEIGQI
jgi:hypothetical protein